jgi:fatty acyl-CoA reductase
MSLCSSIRDEDNKAFYYRDFTEFDITLYFINCILGARRYLLHEKDEDLPKSRLLYQRLKILDITVKFVIYAVIFYIVFVRYNAIDFCKEHLQGLRDALVDTLQMITK